MNIITESMVNENTLNKKILGFFKANQVGQCLTNANAYKSKGTAAIKIVQYLTQLVFTKKSMYMNILNGTNAAGFGKDAVYRLLNATYINWTVYLLQLASNVITKIAATTSEKRLNAILVDDSMFERLRSKKVELLANVPNRIRCCRQA